MIVKIDRQLTEFSQEMKSQIMDRYDSGFIDRTKDIEMDRKTKTIQYLI